MENFIYAKFQVEGRNLIVKMTWRNHHFLLKKFDISRTKIQATGTLFVSFILIIMLYCLNMPRSKNDLTPGGHSLVSHRTTAFCRIIIKKD